MTEITHIFFDLHNTLIDGDRLQPCWSAGCGEFMARRYGLTPAIWTEAHERIVADWNSYFADLDLDGDEGIAAMWEGLYRVTRALFRLVDVAEPPPEQIMALTREMPAYAPARCNAIYPDATPVARTLYTAGYVLGVTSHALSTQARATLQGGDLLAYFNGPLIGPDVAERFRKDAGFYDCATRRAAASPWRCLVIDDDPRAVNGARAAGMRALRICREPGTAHDGIINGPEERPISDLWGLLAALGVETNGPPA
jgi:FMN phosphatase YigB (HAD superfamily)